MKFLKKDNKFEMYYLKKIVKFKISFFGNDLQLYRSVLNDIIYDCFICYLYF